MLISTTNPTNQAPLGVLWQARILREHLRFLLELISYQACEGRLWRRCDEYRMQTLGTPTTKAVHQDKMKKGTGKNFSLQ